GAAEAVVCDPRLGGLPGREHARREPGAGAVEDPHRVHEARSRLPGPVCPLRSAKPSADDTPGDAPPELRRAGNVCTRGKAGAPGGRAGPSRPRWPCWPAARAAGRGWTEPCWPTAPPPPTTPTTPPPTASAAPTSSTSPCPADRPGAACTRW